MSTGPGGSTNSYYDYADLGTCFTSSYMDVFLKISIEAGLLIDESTSHDDVPSHCKSERCSWSPYHTLTVYSRVDDVTNEVIRNDPYYNPEKTILRLKEQISSYRYFQHAKQVLRRGSIQ